MRPVQTVPPAAADAVDARVALYPDDRVAAVTMTFDDNVSSQITTVVPLLGEYGYQASFFVITDNIGPLLDSWGRPWHGTTWNMWKSAAEAGHEIGNHTSGHNLLTTGTAEADQLNLASIMKGYDAIKANTGIAPVSFAFPGGAETDSTRTVIRKTPHIDYRTGTHALPGDRIYPEGDSLTIDAGTGYIRQAMAHTRIWSGAVPSWVLFYMHDVTAARAAVVRGLLDFIRANDGQVWCGTYGDATIYERQREESSLSVQRVDNRSVLIRLTNSLDSAVFHAPLTVVLPMRDPVSEVWAYREGAAPVAVKIRKDRLLLNIVPDARPVHVTWLEAAAQAAPTVALSVAPDSAMRAPAAATLTATVAGRNTALQSLTIHNGPQVLAESTASLLSYTWQAIPAGTYTLTATAQTLSGPVTSQPVVLTVRAAENLPPSVHILSPEDNSTFVAPTAIALSATASDADGSVSNITFYIGSTPVGSCTGGACSISWVNPPAGSHNIVAIATDNGGRATTSSTVRVQVASANRSPTVTITSPANGATLMAPATITLTAAASDPDGQVVSGRFSSGDTLLGVTTAAPFSYTWSNVPPGTYMVTATAVDNQGAATTSDPIRIEVSRPGVASVGTCYSWGLGSSYQLGTGVRESRTVPVAFVLSGESAVTALDGGVAHSVAVKADGTVWAWGLNSSGQLGTGNTIDSTSPARVQNLPPTAAIAAGASHTLALARDGSVWSWGDNGSGQLGIGKWANSTTPALVGGLNNVIALAAGSHHSLALKTDGTVWAWGSGYYGSLGSGSQNTTASPQQIPGLANIRSIAANGYQSAAISFDGKLFSWGTQLNTRIGLSPVAVEIPDARAIELGPNHSLALRNDGTVWAWGAAYSNGATTDLTTPQQVPGLSGIVSVAASAYASYALKSDSTIWAWGRNYNGELGIGTTTSSSIPQPVKGPTGIEFVNSGSYHVLAFGR